MGSSAKMKSINSTTSELREENVARHFTEQYELKNERLVCGDDHSGHDCADMPARCGRRCSRQQGRHHCSRRTYNSVAGDRKVLDGYTQQSNNTGRLIDAGVSCVTCEDSDNRLPPHELPAAEHSGCSVDCTVSTTSFEDVSALERHRATQRRQSSGGGKKRREPAQYVCSQCGRMFSTSTTLNSHVLTHTGERPVVCRVAGCSQRFTQHSTRAFHERTHSDDMPHICAVCGRRFKHAVGVRVHMSTHTGYRPHRCPDCPMLFRRSCDLSSHLLIHTGQKPFSCPSCQKCFRSKKTLSCHVLAIHSDQIPWRCSVCDKGFKTSSNLRVHMRVHTGERPYVCAVCGVRFSYSSSLKTHMHTHPGNDHT